MTRSPKRDDETLGEYQARLSAEYWAKIDAAPMPTEEQCAEWERINDEGLKNEAQPLDLFDDDDNEWECINDAGLATKGQLGYFFEQDEEEDAA